MRRLVAALALPLLGGCVAHTAWDVATAPVKVTSWTVDRLTTSQAGADRNRGRKLRKAEAREGRERQAWTRRCKRTPDTAECRHYTGFRAADAV